MEVAKKLLRASRPLQSASPKQGKKGLKFRGKNPSDLSPSGRDVRSRGAMGSVVNNNFAQAAGQMLVEPIFKHAALEPADLHKLGLAYDSTIAFLELRSDLPKHYREKLALQMILLAQQGERDTDLICQKAIAYLASVQAATASLARI